LDRAGSINPCRGLGSEDDGMSAVGHILKEVDESLQVNEYKQKPLDFLYVKKNAKGFSRMFWSSMGIISLIYILLILHWYDADTYIQNTLLKWQNTQTVLANQNEPRTQQMEDNEGSSENQPSKLPLESRPKIEQPSMSLSKSGHVTEKQNKQKSSTEPKKGVQSLAKTDVESPNPKQLLGELEQRKTHPQVRLTAGNIERQSQKNQKRVRSESIALDKTGIKISSPQHQQLYDAAIKSFDSGDLIEANRLVDESLFLKPTQAAHILKLRMLLLSSVKDIIPYIYKYQLSILDSTELLAIYAQASQRSGQYKKAQWAYQKLLQAEPAHEGWFLGLALSFEHLGNVEQAVKHYHQAIQLTQDEQLKRFALQRVARLQTNLP
jgi:tetratricopeptide (TPR) repeat protein